MFYISRPIRILAESSRLPKQVKLIESQARYRERLYSLQDPSRILQLAFTEHPEFMGKKKMLGFLLYYVYS